MMSERRMRALAMLLLAPFIFYSVLRFFGEVMPFAPIELRGAAAVPSSACPSELIALELTFANHTPRYASLERLSITTPWAQAGEKRTNGGLPYMLPELPEGLHTITTAQDRIAPDSPGEWQLSATVRVTGHVLFTERVQSIPYLSPKIFTALPETVPPCN